MLKPAVLCFTLHLLQEVGGGGGGGATAPLASPPMTYGSHVSCLFLPSSYARLLFTSNILFITKHRSIDNICPIRQLLIRQNWISRSSRALSTWG